jgi:hypothetical protein
MIVRVIELDKEYDTISTWWTCRNLPPVPKAILRGADGFVVRAANFDIVAGWIYLSKGISFAEWTVSNPHCPSNSTIAASIAKLYDFFEHFSKSQGCPTVLSGVQDNGSMSRFLQSHGWMRCESKPHQFLVKTVA